jgi:CRP-like cAMP-binding protein
MAERGDAPDTGGRRADEPARPDVPARAGVPVERLGGMWLLHGLPPQQLRDLAAACQERHYAPGEVILRRGDPSDALYFVAAGTVQVYGRAESGERLLAQAQLSECFGEMGALDGEPRSATAVATSRATCYWVPADAFVELLEQAPLVGMKLTLLLSQRLRRTNSLMAELPGPVHRVEDGPEP